jgi:cation:H+ antiporter
MTTLLLLIAGFVGLVAGGDLLVRGAARMAAAFGIAPLVVGLTVVAFGTSAPELAVGVAAGASGASDVALGNVVGSNICNVLLILGLSALVAPLTVQRQLVRQDVPVMIVVSCLVLLLGLDGRIGRLDGVVLAAGVVLYTVVLLVQARRSPATDLDGNAPEASPAARGSGWRARVLDVLLIAVGIGMLVVGARWLVEGASAVARAMQVSELVIGLTVVALGTSLPELATSIVAALRGERDIAVGNVVGSNLFNLLAVLGLSSAVLPGGIPVGPAGDDRGRCGVPADLLHRIHRRPLGGRVVPRLLRGVRHVAAPRGHPCRCGWLAQAVGRRIPGAVDRGHPGGAGLEDAPGWAKVTLSLARARRGDYPAR